MSCLLVSGTSTGVGKTVVTAALAAGAVAAGRTVAVCKPAQTGVGPGEPGDLDEIERLCGVRGLELARYPDPLAPDTAARVAGLPPLRLGDVVAAVRGLDADRVLVEGAGGLLVGLGRVSRFPSGAPGARLPPGGVGVVADTTTVSDSSAALPDRQSDPQEHPAGIGRRGRADFTLVDLARALRAPVLVVAAPGLGTLNHSALTVRELAASGVECAGLVVGSWPDDPDLAMRCNLDDLPRVTGVPLLGRIPDGAGAWPRDRFLAAAPSWLTLPC